VTPYYDEDGLCACGCGRQTALVQQTIRRLGVVKGQRRRYVSGHNLSGAKTAKHREAIAEGQRRAWMIKRQRLPLGSRRLSHDGYVLVKVVEGEGHWRSEHALVVEAAIGRPLRRSEVVHHINGDRADNRLENLYLCRDRSHHNQVHASQDAALRVLLASGVVVFKDGQYAALLH